MTPILFVDRDGTLIAEPGDFQIDRFDKLRFVDRVVPALLRLRDAGYEFVIVSNQDGLGGEGFPQADFDGPHALMLQLFESQGIRFREVHATAMQVIARHVAAWGMLPVSAEEALEADQQQHRRYMVHGTSHHLGLDVHDCAQARREFYIDGVVEAGMTFTIEPGLYFQPDDLTVPEEFRGIGVRIEDDILVTETGAENLSVAIPRTADDIEAWIARLRA